MNHFQDVLTALGLGMLMGWATLGAMSVIVGGWPSSPPASRYRLIVCMLTAAALVEVAPIVSSRSAGTSLGAQLYEATSSLTTTAGASASPTSQRLPFDLDALWGPVRSNALLSGGLALLGLLWGVLATGALLRLTASWVRLRRLIQRADVAPSGWTAELEEMAQELGVTAPALRITSELSAPAIAGAVRPKLLLPAYFFEQIAREGRLLALRHELLHLVRRDHLSTPLVHFAGVVLAGHPRLQELSEQCSSCRELAVDARVAPRAPASYASLLLEVARRASGSPLSELALAMAHGQTRTRIERLLSPPELQSSPWPGALAAAVVVAASLVACSWGAARSDDETPTTSGEAADAESAAANQGSPPLLADPARPGTTGDRMGAVAVSGRLPPEVIRQVMRSQFGRFRSCYEQVEQREAREARLVLHFVIAPDGSVQSSRVDAEDLPEAASCLSDAVRALRFPAPAGGEVSVMYPIILTPG